MILKKYGNLTGRLVMLRLNSGQTMFIEPGTVSNEIPEEEVMDNTCVNKLLQKEVIAVYTVESPPDNPIGLEAEKKEKPGLKPDPVPGNNRNISRDAGENEPDSTYQTKKQKSKSRGGE